MTVQWLEQGRLEVPLLDDWLSAAEAATLAAMRFEKRRADWRLGRWTAKLAVSAYLNIPGDSLRQLEIRPELSGAPAVWLRDRPAPVTISLSHRDGAAICTVAEPGVSLGCDLEVVEPRSSAFLADYFTQEEQAFVEQAPASDRPRLLALLWSAKESALKALRVGLRLDTRCVVVSALNALDPNTCDSEWRPLEISCPRKRFSGWWRHTGQVVRTVVAFPPSPPPREIIPSESLPQST
jgi:4'-phosphopantetheinyl transferase